MDEKEAINALCAAVARLLYEASEDGEDLAVVLGDGGTLVEVDKNGQVYLDGVPTGDADVGFRSVSSLVEPGQ